MCTVKLPTNTPVSIGTFCRTVNVTPTDGNIPIQFDITYITVSFLGYTYLAKDSPSKGKNVLLVEVFGTEEKVWLEI